MMAGNKTKGKSFIPVGKKKPRDTWTARHYDGGYCIA